MNTSHTGALTPAFIIAGIQETEKYLPLVGDFLEAVIREADIQVKFIEPSPRSPEYALGRFGFGLIDHAVAIDNKSPMFVASLIEKRLLDIPSMPEVDNPFTQPQADFGGLLRAMAAGLTIFYPEKADTLDQLARAHGVMAERTAAPTKAGAKLTPDGQ